MLISWSTNGAQIPFVGTRRATSSFSWSTSPRGDTWSATPSQLSHIYSASIKVLLRLHEGSIKALLSHSPHTQAHSFFGLAHHFFWSLIDILKTKKNDVPGQKKIFCNFHDRFHDLLFWHVFMIFCGPKRGLVVDEGLCGLCRQQYSTLLTLTVSPSRSHKHGLIKLLSLTRVCHVSVPTPGGKRNQVAILLLQE
jgi:hypothetical protein